MSSLQDLLDRKAALEKEIEATRRQERGEAISKVKTLMSQYGLTLSDLNAKGVRALFALPSAISTTSIVASSVTRRPWDWRFSIPSLFIQRSNQVLGEFRAVVGWKLRQFSLQALSGFAQGNLPFEGIRIMAQIK